MPMPAGSDERYVDGRLHCIYINCPRCGTQTLGRPVTSSWLWRWHTPDGWLCDDCTHAAYSASRTSASSPQADLCDLSHGQAAE